MTVRCGKCSMDMEEGFLLEKGDGGVLSPQAWITGKPEKSLFTGLKLKGRQVYDVRTYRCTGCGFLESYAEEMGVRKR